jgi:peptidoglycan/xylan/chitin deacetylase (PgdA/CDA1 family)
MKVLEARFRDGSVWQVPCTVIAAHRAKYYAAKDPDTTYDAEYTVTMDDNYELKDWCFGNMNISDLQPHAVMVQPPVPVTFDDGWNDCDNTTHEVRDLP